MGNLEQSISKGKELIQQSHRINADIEEPYFKSEAKKLIQRIRIHKDRTFLFKKVSSNPEVVELLKEIKREHQRTIANIRIINSRGTIGSLLCELAELREKKPWVNKIITVAIIIVISLIFKFVVGPIFFLPILKWLNR